MTFGIWVSQTVDFTSLRTPGPRRQEIYGWRGWPWRFYIAFYGVDKAQSINSQLQESGAFEVK